MHRFCLTYRANFIFLNKLIDLINNHYTVIWCVFNVYWAYACQAYTFSGILPFPFLSFWDDRRRRGWYDSTEVSYTEAAHCATPVYCADCLWMSGVLLLSSQQACGVSLTALCVSRIIVSRLLGQYGIHPTDAPNDPTPPAVPARSWQIISQCGALHCTQV